MTEFSRSLAVVIGINEYQNGITRLKTAVPDAIASIHPGNNPYNSLARALSQLKDKLPQQEKNTASSFIRKGR